MRWLLFAMVFVTVVLVVTLTGEPSRELVALSRANHNQGQIAEAELTTPLVSDELASETHENDARDASDQVLVEQESGASVHNTGSFQHPLKPDTWTTSERKEVHNTGAYINALDSVTWDSGLAGEENNTGEAMDALSPTSWDSLERSEIHNTGAFLSPADRYTWPESSATQTHNTGTYMTALPEEP